MECVFGHYYVSNGGVALTWTTGTGTANVTNMRSMFGVATTFNQDISSWNVSNVTDMNNMFVIASIFDQDLSSWNVSSVTDMSKIFYNAFAFNNGGVALTWTAGTGTANVTDIICSKIILRSIKISPHGMCLRSLLCIKCSTLLVHSIMVEWR